MSREDSTEPAPQRAHDLYEAEHTDRRTARLGLLLFAVYAVVYAVFVGLCAFARDIMKTRTLGVNAAVIYGFILIIFPFVLAALYLFLTSKPSRDSEGRA